MKKLSKKAKIGIIVSAAVCALSAIIAFILISLPKPQEEKPAEKPHYTVTFETDGGEVVESQPVPDGELVTKPASPKKDGYSFVDWYSDKELTVKYNFSEPVHHDLTLYAKWEIKTDDPTSKEKSEEQSSTAPPSSANSSTNKTSNTSSQSRTTSTSSSSSAPSSSTPSEPSSEPHSEPAPAPEPKPAPVYKIVATPIDDFAPDVEVAVTRDGAPVSFSSISANGQILCNAPNNHVNKGEISSISSFSVTLSTGEVVTATK